MTAEKRRPFGLYAFQAECLIPALHVLTANKAEIERELRRRKKTGLGVAQAIGILREIIGDEKSPNVKGCEKC